jgi:hypothetical protein
MAKNEKEKSVSFPDGKNLEDERQKTLLMKDYEPPKTKKTGVETEGGFCASEPSGTIDATEQDPIEVKEYVSIGGDDGKIDITFD